jgi:hypothetical protein
MEFPSKAVESMSLENPYASPATDVGHLRHPKKKRLTRIGPLRAGIVLGVLYALLALLFLPFLFVAMMISREAAMIGIGFAIAMPILYGVMGFIGGVIAAAVYNLVAGWTGGLEFEIVDESQNR